MARIRFSLKFSPKNFLHQADLLQEDYRKEGDKMIKTIRKVMVFEMKKAAPGPGQPGPYVDKSVRLDPRSGRLKRGIKPVPFKKTNSGLDRRANIIVESRSPHTRFVVKGVSRRYGEGAKGKGRYDPTIGKRLRYGLYPGFKGYDFIEVAKENVQKQLGDIVDKKLTTMKHHIRRRLTV